jgi:formate--tetrahydrofolate ligase
MQPIKEISQKLNIEDQYVLPYGHYKAKIDIRLWDHIKDRQNGHLILVTAINPTPAGEGKTTISVGLSQGLQQLGKKVVLALREPSLGPVFGLKGGATGGGLASVVPEEDINLHFTGDLHAITAANNLLSALIDNHIFQGNELGIENVVWPRVMDMNDRNLRNIQTDLREDHFIITAASEVMAIFAMASNLKDLKARINRILIGYTKDQAPVYVSDLKAADAMVMLLKDAFNPNLVQALEGVPTLVHAGPFANIAHGCNSIMATKMALKLGDYVVTEAGFGADLGMEKFLHLKLPNLNHEVSVVVVVATLKALKLHGGETNYQLPNLNALKQGIENLEKHIENIQTFNLPFVVALNYFEDDPKDEITWMFEWATQKGVTLKLAKGFKEGGKGMTELAEAVLQKTFAPHTFKPLYQKGAPIQSTIETIAKTMYGASAVNFSKTAQKQIKQYETLGWNLPICMAKTPLSLSGDGNLKGRPKDFTIDIQSIRPSLGAGFLVAQTKGIMVMPGLNKTPRALRFEMQEDGSFVERDL